MILKPRSTPLIVHQLKALLRRLPLNDPRRPTIENNLVKFEKGHRGELQLDHYLNFLTTNNHFLIQGLRLPDSFGGHFQIDTLLLTTRYLCVFEVKNWTGSVSFDPALEQTTRKFNGTEEGCSDPISQVLMQRTHLLRWLQKHRFPTINIHPFVVISHPTTIINVKSNFKLVADHVLHAHAVLDRLEKIEKKESTEFLDKKILRRIGKTMVKHHIPKKDDVLKRYRIEVSELITGVCCEDCNRYSMIRAHGRWCCLSCGASSKTAHLKALEEYFLLIGEEITNHQARVFLRVSHRNVVTHMFKEMKLYMKGKNKNARYQLTFLDK